MAEPATLHVDGKIAVLTLDDGRGNAIGPALLERLECLLPEAEAGHALVIHGRERLFCGGLDLPALATFDRRRMEEFFTAFNRVHARLLSFPRPIVTVARGSAIAGGAILFCAGDLRLATPEGKIGVNETVLGMSFPTPALELVRCALGEPRAAEASLSGRIYEGDERVRVGFVTEVVSADRIASRAMECAVELAAADPEAVAQVRRQLRRDAIERVRVHAERDTSQFLDRWFTAGAQERIRAVLEKLRRP